MFSTRPESIGDIQKRKKGKGKGEGGSEGGRKKKRDREMREEGRGMDIESTWGVKARGDDYLNRL